MARKDPVVWNSAGIFSYWFMVGIQVVAVVVEAEIVTVRVAPVATGGILSFWSFFSSVLELMQPNQT